MASLCTVLMQTWLRVIISSVKDKNEGKKFVTLDGEEHILGEHDLAICNEEDPMCIAGVFGGRVVELTKRQKM